MKMRNVEWKLINWKTVATRVFELQKDIYNKSKCNDTEGVYRLQKILINSPEAKFLSVRRVTQDNRGKNTPGIDGVKSLNPPQRIELVRSLKIDGKSDSIKRISIPKSPPGEMRLLGIPTLRDRAKQALALLALEPEWEAKFEPNSYGFRPGRSCHDAIEGIHIALNRKEKFVLEADIAKCFDRINHEALLLKMNTFPQMRNQIRSWLKAGILNQGKTLFPEEGTPQGGVISPLLANIALHGMETFLKDWISEIPLKDSHGVLLPKVKKRKQLSLVRYADDFVILDKDLEIIQKSKHLLSEWLKPLSLELKESKTRIVHSFNSFENQQPGFDFLGFTIRQFPVSKYGRGRLGNPFRTFIKPSRNSIKRHLLSLKTSLKEHRDTGSMVRKLSPIIRGWCNYYRSVSSSATFTGCEKIFMEYLFSWAKKKHPNRPKKWIFRKYLRRIWGTENSGVRRKKNRSRLQFGYENQNGDWVYLRLHSTMKIKRHVKIIGTRSPYDGDFVYWSLRNQNRPTHSRKFLLLIKRQRGLCAHCQLVFQPTDIIEIDHIIPKNRGGKNSFENLQLLHGHCHDEKSREDRHDS